MFSLEIVYFQLEVLFKVPSAFLLQNQWWKLTELITLSLTTTTYSRLFILWMFELGSVVDQKRPSLNILSCHLKLQRQFLKSNWQFTSKLKLKKTYKPKRTNIRSRLCFQKSWCLHCEVSPLYTILVTDKGFHRPKDENFIISYLCQ